MILPDANVVKLGGQSLIDRPKRCFSSDRRNRRKFKTHKMIIGTGAGTRARHAYSVGLI
ncbi:MAG: hypothetical protein R3A45_08140 [Bdellovibrionota bacterium]